MPGKMKIVKVIRTPKGVRKITQRVSAAAQAKQAQHENLVTIEDSTIQMILADPRYLAAVPCLANGKQALSTVGKRCGRCQRKRLQLRRDAMGQIKSCIAGLRGEQAATFKQLLGAKKVRVFHTAGKGRKPIPTTF
jgi:hypothetical protein